MATRKLIKEPVKAASSKQPSVSAQEAGSSEENPAISDSVSQAGEEVAGLATAMATGSLLQSTGQSMALAALNAAHAQQQNNMSAFSVAVAGLNTLYSENTSTDTTGTANILVHTPRIRRKSNNH